jgi:hypothetical protein
MLSIGLIDSVPPMGAPAMFTTKRDGCWRMCIGYHAINVVTIKKSTHCPASMTCLICSM